MKKLLLTLTIILSANANLNLDTKGITTPPYNPTALTEKGHTIALGYGEYSPKTYQPATERVNGYYKSNGTYVDSYYRS